MSITFYLARTNQEGHVVPACDGHFGGPCTEADHIFDRDDYGTCDCDDAAEAACGICRLAINMSNVNARLVLERLDVLPEGWAASGDDAWGSMSPMEICGRAMVGNVGRDDSGTPATTYGGPGTGRATIHQSGLPEGYFDGRMGEIVRLAIAANDHDMMVAWS